MRKETNDKTDSVSLKKRRRKRGKKTKERLTETRRAIFQTDTRSKDKTRKKTLSLLSFLLLLVCELLNNSAKALSRDAKNELSPS